MIGTFKTRHRSIHAIAFVFTRACFVGATYSGYRFAIATEVHDQLMWGGLCNWRLPRIARHARASQTCPGSRGVRSLGA